MDSFKKKSLIIFSITLFAVSAGVGIYFQITTTRTWYTTTESNFLSLNRNDGKKIDFSGDNAFVGLELFGFKVYDFSDPQNPSLINTTRINGCFITDQFVVGDRFYIVDHREILIYNISNLQDIQKIGNYSLVGPREDMICSIYINEDVAYLANRLSFEIIDISDPQNVVSLSQISVRYSEMHDLTYNNGLVYYANAARGLDIYNVSDPTSPELFIKLEDYGYGSLIDNAIEVSVINDIIYLSDSEHGLILFDATDINDIYRINIYTASIPEAIFEDGTNIYLADEYIGLRTLSFTSLPELNILCDFNARSGIFDVQSFDDSLAIVGRNGISIVSIIRGAGRNPERVNFAKRVIPGVYEITGAGLLVIYLYFKLKRSNI